MYMYIYTYVCICTDYTYFGGRRSKRREYISKKTCTADEKLPFTPRRETQRAGARARARKRANKQGKIGETKAESQKRPIHCQKRPVLSKETAVLPKHRLQGSRKSSRDFLDASLVPSLPCNQTRLTSRMHVRRAS